MPSPARGLVPAAGAALLGLALLAGFTALPRGGPRDTVLESVEAAAQHAAGGRERCAVRGERRRALEQDMETGGRLLQSD